MSYLSSHFRNKMENWKEKKNGTGEKEKRKKEK
jgi:hypothetical protein